jgi:hypothetical protein
MIGSGERLQCAAGPSCSRMLLLWFWSSGVAARGSTGIAQVPAVVLLPSRFLNLSHFLTLRSFLIT